MSKTRQNGSKRLKYLCFDSKNELPRCKNHTPDGQNFFWSKVAKKHPGGSPGPFSTQKECQKPKFSNPGPLAREALGGEIDQKSVQNGPRIDFSNSIQDCFLMVGGAPGTPQGLKNVSVKSAEDLRGGRGAEVLVGVDQRNRIAISP